MQTRQETQTISEFYPEHKQEINLNVSTSDVTQLCIFYVCMLQTTFVCCYLVNVGKF